MEVLLHFAGTVRAFYASVAKAVHAQARRRDDPSFQPTASTKAASVTLGVILTRNLNPPNQVTHLYRVVCSQQSALEGYHLRTPSSDNKLPSLLGVLGSSLRGV